MPSFRRLPEPNTHGFIQIPTGILVTPILEDEKKNARKEVSDYIQQKHKMMGPLAVAEMKRESASFYKKITDQKEARSN